MARAGLFSLPCDESRQGARGRTLRLDEQPQFRRPPGPRRAHAPRQPRDGRSGGGDGQAHRCAGVDGMTPLAKVEGRAIPFGLKNVDTDEIGRASCRERVCQTVKISWFAVSLKKKNK